MKILPPEGATIVPSKEMLRELVRRSILNNAHLALASFHGMIYSTHVVKRGDQILAYLHEKDNKEVTVLPVVTPARASRGVTQYEFDNLLALLH